MTFGLKLAGAAMLISTALVSTASAQEGKWERLGCERVGNRTDFDVIKVGRREGRFSAIRLEAEGNSVEVLDLKVVYANGSPDDIPVRAHINQGDRTRALDLRGRDRAIDRIQIVSKKDREGPGRGRAQICVYGREG